jgi:ABC-type molybdate transport system permease subunit
LQTSPISVGGKFAGVMLTFHIIIGEFGSTQFSFVEDITATLPDVVIGANSSFVVGCPKIKP